MNFKPSRLFSDAEIEDLRKRGEREAKYFADFVVIDTLWDIAKSKIVQGSTELALDQLRKQQIQTENLIAKLLMEQTHHA